MYEVKPKHSWSKHSWSKHSWSKHSWKLPMILLASVVIAELPNSALASEAVHTAEPCPTTPALTIEAVCYRLEAPAPGFLVVAIAASDPSDAPPLLRLTGHKPATHLTLWIREGTEVLTVAVTPREDGQALGEHELTSYFLAEGNLVALIESEASQMVKDFEEGEIDPILAVTGSSCSNSSDCSSSDFGQRRPGIYTVLVEDRYSLVFKTLSW